MIQTLFILSPTGEVLIERHFRDVVTSRRVCDSFWNRASLSINHHGGVSNTSSLLQDSHRMHYDTVPPVMELPAEQSSQGTLYVISILRDGLSYLAVCPSEVSPLLILEFLHRIASIFQDYFGGTADESAIKDNFSTVYQVLEEMVDHGWPLTTEPNALKAMIRPPAGMMSQLLSSNVGASTMVSEELPSGTISNMPWRAAGVHYANNEIYMDIVEEVDAITTSGGTLVSTDVSGTIQCQSHLSGLPDLLLTFKDPHLIDDCSFHPCVRYARFEKDQIVSFVPPDGDFELMRYRIRSDKTRHFQPPVYCHAQWSFVSDDNNNNSNPRSTTSPASTTTATPVTKKKQIPKEGRVLLQAGVTSLSSLMFSATRKAAMTGGAGSVQVEEVSITIPFPKQTRTTSDFRVNVGSVVYDESSKMAKWTIGNLDVTKKASLSCRFTLAITNTNTSSNAGGKPTAATSLLLKQQKKTLASSSGMYGTHTAANYTANNTAGSVNFYNRNDFPCCCDEDELTEELVKEDYENISSSSFHPPNLSLHWKLPLASVSGLSVSGLSITGENYRPYKGVRNITKSGLYQVRCS